MRLTVVASRGAEHCGTLDLDKIMEIYARRLMGDISNVVEDEGQDFEVKYDGALWDSGKSEP